MKISDIIESDFFKNISERFALILAIPYFIGGLIQFIELSNISINLIKFFSISQLLVEGLFVSAQLLVLFVILYYIGLALNKINNNKIYVLIGIIFFISFWGSGFMMYYSINSSKPAEVINYYVIGFLVSNCLLLSLIMEKNLLKIGHFFILFFVYYLASKAFTTDNKIQNISVLTNKLKLEYPNITLRYYNDQYLFYEKDFKNQNSEIIIRKMDDIFEEKKSDEK